MSRKPVTLATRAHSEVLARYHKRAYPTEHRFTHYSRAIVHKRPAKLQTKIPNPTTLDLPLGRKDISRRRELFSHTRGPRM